MTYKESLTAAMDDLAKDPLVRFLGYGIRVGGKAGGTLKNVRDLQLIECTVTESLMASMAIGLSLRGLKPVVYFERFDFILNALDAIVNHLDKLKSISRSEFIPAVILRVVVGNKEKPLFTGPTHCQDFTEAMKHMISFPVLTLHEAEEIKPAYAAAHRAMSVPDRNFRSSTLLVEYKEKI